MGRGQWHGYRLAPGTDIFDFTDRLRRDIGVTRDRLDAAMLMSAAVRRIDRADADGIERDPTPLFSALTDFDDAQRLLLEKHPESRAFNPHRFEVTFARDTGTADHPGTGRILALLFTEHPTLVAAWEALPEVEPYGHFTFTDRPGDLDDTVWAERGSAWSRVRPDLTSPAETMLTFTLRNDPPHDNRPVTLVMSASTDASDPRETARRTLLTDVALTRRQRAVNLAANLVGKAWLERRRDLHGTEPTGGEASTFMRRIAVLPAEDTQPCEAVVGAVDEVLRDDVIDWAIDGHDISLASPREIHAAIERAIDGTPAPGSPYALDMGRVHAEIATYLDAIDG